MGLSAVLRGFESVHGIRERRAIYDPLRGLGSRLERAEAADDLDALAGVQEAAAAHIGRLAHAGEQSARRVTQRQAPNAQTQTRPKRRVPALPTYEYYSKVRQ